MIGDDTQVSVTGTADLDYLKLTVTIEFLADVAKGGTVKGKDHSPHCHLAHRSAHWPAPAGDDRPGQEGIQGRGGEAHPFAR